jgi:hypothetical protein
MVFDPSIRKQYQNKRPEKYQICSQSLQYLFMNIGKGLAAFYE